MAWRRRGLFEGEPHGVGMEAVRNTETEVWHLLGSRGCGVDAGGDAYGDVVDGSWAVIRDTVDRDAGTRCRRCRWPPR